MEASESFAMSESLDGLDGDDAVVAEDDALRIRRWRTVQLHRLGMSWWRAYAVAPLVDWHDVARLVALGCSAELAVDIVR